MRFSRLHEWVNTYESAVALQERLRRLVRIEPLRFWPSTVAGVDVSYDRASDNFWAGVVVMRLPGLEEVEEVTVLRRSTFPYIPGLLSFREGPAVLAAFEKLRTEPEVVIFDGQGLAHPRRLGLASHMGLWLDRPSVGCAKSRLIGEHPPVPDRVVLEDGRILEGCKVERVEQALFIRFPHGLLPVDSSRIKEIVRDIDETCTPADEFERRQLTKGLVFFEGVWCSKKRRDAVLAERRRKREARLEKMAAHLSWENPWRKETAHFEVLTNTSEHLLEYYADLLEAFYQGFCKRWGQAASRGMKGRRPVVEIYRSAREYYASGIPRDSEGVFQAREMKIRLYHDEADPRFTLDVLFHEVTHLMVHLMRPDFVFPEWLDEGLAEYFGASRPDGKGKIRWGGVQEGRLACLRHALREDRYLPLEKVMLSSGSRFGALHYAESWCFVNFLMEHKKYRPRFMSFVNCLVSGMGVDETVISMHRGRSLYTVKSEEVVRFLEKKLGVSAVSDLEREFLEYVYYGLPDVGSRGFAALARLKFREMDFDGALEDLAAAGVTPDLLERVHTPIGLPIGGVTVNEIALSIAAELVQVRRSS